jgi:hypothetical protein
MIGGISSKVKIIYQQMMASQKVRPPALQRLFKTSTYNMYAFTLEQPLRLGVRIFYLAILFVFTRPSTIAR